MSPEWVIGILVSLMLGANTIVWARLESLSREISRLRHELRNAKLVLADVASRQDVSLPDSYYGDE